MARRVAGRIGSKFRGAGQDRKGVSAVEFALIAPMLLLMLAGVVDVSRCLWYMTDVAQSVRAGVEYMTGNPNDSTGTAAFMRGATVLGSSSGFTADASQCTCQTSTDPNPSSPTPWAQRVTWSACSSLTCVTAPVHRYVQVTASYTWTPVFGSMSFLPSPVKTTIYLRVK
jgi:Flp pilus assembly protein TadG